MAVSFGVSSFPLITAYGIAQNVEISDDCGMATRKNANGDITHSKAFSRIKKASFEVICDGDTPMAGDWIYLELGGDQYRITSAKFIESNEDFKRLQVEAEAYLTIEDA
jgi:hypothetical protein